jgi:hypothetical protein
MKHNQLAHALLKHDPSIRNNVKHAQISEAQIRLHGQIVKHNPIAHALLKHRPFSCN